MLKKQLSVMLIFIVLISSVIYNNVSAEENAFEFIPTASVELGSVLSANGDLWVWGSNYDGQLGTGDRNDVRNPIKVMENTKKYRKGYSTGYFLKLDGTLWACGLNTNGSFGSRKYDYETLNPVCIMENVKEFTYFSERCAAITHSGDLFIWGDYSGGTVYDMKQIDSDVKCFTNEHGDYAKNDGTEWNMNIVSGKVTSKSYYESEFIKKATIGDTTYVLLKDGTLRGWSKSANDLISDDSIYKSPVIFSDVKNFYVNNYKDDDDHSCILTLKNGETWAWGNHDWKYLKKSVYDNKEDEYVPHKLKITNVKDVKFHDEQFDISPAVLFLKDDHSLWVTGENYDWHEHIFTGNPEEPIQIDDNVSEIINFSSNYITVKKEDNSLWTWGCGLHVKTDINYGDAIIDNVFDWDYFDDTFIALKNDGTVWMWGNNDSIYDVSGYGEFIKNPVKILDGIKVGSDDIETGFEFYSSKSTMMFGEGEIFDIGVKYKINNVVQPISTVSDFMKVSIMDDDIAEITDVRVEEYEKIYTVKTKKSGITSIKATDYSGKTSTSAKIIVESTKNNVYTIHNVPCGDFYEGTIGGADFTTPKHNFYVGGLYVNSFSKNVHEDETCDMSFDVYNQNYSYGIVEVYDRNNVLKESYFLDKYRDLNTGITESTLGNIGRLVSIKDTGFFTYKNESVTQHTHVDIKNIPSGGYIKITADSCESPYLAIINCLDMVMSARGIYSKTCKSIDELFSKEDKFKIFNNFLYELSKQNNSNALYKNFANTIYKELGNTVIKNAADCTALVNDIDSILKEIDWESVLTSAWEKAAVSYGEDIFINLTGPVKGGFDICFTIGKTTNLLLQCMDVVNLANGSFAQINVPGDYSKTDNKITVQFQDKIDADIVLQTYKVAIEDISTLYPNIFKILSTGEYSEIYNISLIHNGKETQVNSKATVTIPLSDEFKSKLGIIRVFRIEADGSMTEMKLESSQIEREYVKFTTDHFSLYAIVVGDLNVSSDTSTIITIGEKNISVSDWAKTEIEEAYKLELVPEFLSTTDFSSNASREDFAAIAVKLYEKLSGSDYIGSNSPFADIASCKNKDAINDAYELDIVTGTSASTFEPYSYVTREQMATMLCRVFKKYAWNDWSIENDEKFKLDYAINETFSDDAYISAYAVPSVYFMNYHGIINGVGENLFAPAQTATIEQAIAISLRSYRNLFNGNIIRDSLISNVDYNELYKSFILENANNTDNVGFILSDVNNDGTPEMFFASKYSDNTFSGYRLAKMFSVKNGDVIEITPWKYDGYEEVVMFNKFPDNVLGDDTYISNFTDLQTGEYFMGILSKDKNDDYVFTRINYDIHSGASYGEITKGYPEYSGAESEAYGISDSEVIGVHAPEWINLSDIRQMALLDSLFVK